MKYSEVRSKLKTGDLVFWGEYKGGSFRSVVERWLVRHKTASPLIHVGLLWVDHERVWVMDITTEGCAPKLLSNCHSFYWIAAPRQLSEAGLTYAFGCFGKLTYSRWQALLGSLQRLRIGVDLKSQCAEFVITVLAVDAMAPSEIATPAACADGAMKLWNSAMIAVSMD